MAESLLGYSPVFVDVLELARCKLELEHKIPYVGNKSMLYHHLFGKINLDSYHIIDIDRIRNTRLSKR